MGSIKVMVTGGAGFIGSHCVDHLLNAGHEVGVFDLIPKIDAKNLTQTMGEVNYVSGDIRSVDQLAQACRGYTHILHLAAIVSVPKSIQDPIGTHVTNVDGTLNVLQVSRKLGIEKLVYASSAAVYGDTHTIPTKESAELKPQSPYGLQKQINESYAFMFQRQYGVSSVGLRFFNVYGSRQDPRSPYSGVISIFLRKMIMKTEPEIFGDGTATRDFVHVSDVAKTCCVSLHADHFNEYVCNVGTGKQIQVSEVVNELNKILGSSIEPIFLPSRDGDVKHSCASTERLCSLVKDYCPRDINFGLQEIINS